MTLTATIVPMPDRLLALERANDIRRARAQLKRRIGDGQLSVAEVILDPPVEAGRWPVAELLVSQRHWGAVKCRRFLAQTGSARSSRSESSQSVSDACSLRSSHSVGGREASSPEREAEPRVAWRVALSKYVCFVR
ncbi:MAG: hypothetical protein ACLP0J_17175 [Solirubrobacteraceae bacterium]|jgi:hypothetical protein